MNCFTKREKIVCCITGYAAKTNKNATSVLAAEGKLQLLASCHMMMRDSRDKNLT